MMVSQKSQSAACRIRSPFQFFALKGRTSWSLVI